MADAVKSVKCIGDALEVVREIGKLVKKLPQSDTKLEKIRSETKNDSRGVHDLCPTRRTVRALAATLNNHSELGLVTDHTNRHRNESKNSRCPGNDDII